MRTEPRKRITFVSRDVVLSSAPVEVVIAEDAKIYNAPRPLYGHVRWQGPFFEGIFYAALEPNGDYVERWTLENARLDACELVFADEDAAIEWSLNWYREKYAKRPEIFASIDPQNREHRSMLLRRYMDEHSERE